MPLDVDRKETAKMGFEVTERLYLTADKERVVPEGHPDAAFLYATPGKTVSDEDAARYGLKSAAKSAAKTEDKSATVDEDKAAEPAKPKRTTRKS